MSGKIWYALVVLSGLEVTSAAEVNVREVRSIAISDYIEQGLNIILMYLNAGNITIEEFKQSYVDRSRSFKVDLDEELEKLMKYNNTGKVYPGNHSVILECGRNNLRKMKELYSDIIGKVAKCFEETTSEGASFLKNLIPLVINAVEELQITQQRAESCPGETYLLCVTAEWLQSAKTIKQTFIEKWTLSSALSTNKVLLFANLAKCIEEFTSLKNSFDRILEDNEWCVTERMNPSAKSAEEEEEDEDYYTEYND